MAAQPNEVTIVGNVTRDPELKFTQGGQAVANVGIAYNTRKKNNDGEWVEGDAMFFNITCWGTLAENVGDSISKGDRVVVVGRLEQRSWETKEGDKRTAVEIIAEEISPSLRWATADVKRTESRGGGRDSGGRSSGGGGGSSRGGNSGGRGNDSGYDPNEEPF